MYLRFVTPVRGTECRSELGFFHGVYHIFDQAHLNQDWRRIALREEVDWFNDHLDAPDWLSRRFGRHGYRSGVCWFRDAARECISRARYCAWLMCDLGYPVEEIRTRSPGTLIWSDADQVVALAGPHVPRAFA